MKKYYAHPRGSNAFTLIELIVVIVLLSILAIFALSRFADLSTQSHISVLKGLQGTMRSMAALVHVQAVMQNVSNTGSDAARAVTTEYGLVDSWYQYPESRAELGSRLGMLELIDLQTSADLQQTVTNNYVRVGYNLTVGSTGCYIEYYEASSSGPPSYTLEIRGC